MNCLDCGKKTSENCYKYCKVCGYKHRTRRSGLKYIKHKENPTSFKKGHTPWLKGMDMREKASNWKGDDVSVDGLHGWIEKRLGKPMICEFCKTTESKIYQWSNKNHLYKRELSDWQRLCVSCHQRYDFEKFGDRLIFYKTKTK